MPKTHGFATWEDALTEALTLIKDIKPNQRLASVAFGTFSESVGGGHYVSLSVCYELGNTATAGREHGETERKRTAQVVDAWSRAVAESRAAEESA